MGEGEMGEEPNSYDCKKAWSSINHSVLSAVGGKGDVVLLLRPFKLQQWLVGEGIGIVEEQPALKYVISVMVVDCIRLVIHI
jgi:hypothetical protein